MLAWPMRRLAAFAAVLALSVRAFAAPVPAEPPITIVLGPRAADVEPLLGAIEAAARAEGAAVVDLTPPSPAAPVAPRALRAAIEAYEAFRGDDAWARLEEAHTEVRKTGGAGLTAGELGELYLYRALVAAQRGDATRAWDEELRAVTIDPTRVLDPLRFPPRALETWTRARAALDAAPRGKLIVTGLEATCALIVDGRPAPLESTLPAGEHLVRGECPGAAPWGRVVVVAGPAAPTELAAPPPAMAAATGEAALALATRRGATSALTVAVQLGGGPPTARLTLIAVPTGTPRRQSLVAAGPRAAVDATAAVRALIGEIVRPTSPIVTTTPPRPEPRRWTRSPWLWAAVGAAAATLIVLPIALTQGGESDNLDLHLGGSLPR